MKTPRPSFVRCASLLAALACASSTSFASLIYYLPFDNGTTSTLANSGTVGGSATDVSQSLAGAPANGSGNTSFVTTTAPGLGSSHALRLPEYRSRLELPDDVSGSIGKLRAPQAGETVTLSTWIYLDQAALGFSTILGMSTGAATADTGSGWNIGLTNTGQIDVAFRYTTGGGAQTSGSVKSSAVITAQDWAHVVVQWTFGSSLKMFVDGAAVYTNNTFGNIPNANTSPVTLRGTNMLQDDFAVWDHALSNAEIAALSKAPALASLAGYNAGKLDPLFSLHRAAGSGTITEGSISWTYVTGFDVTGRTLGDVWTVGNSHYMWLGGDAANSTGLLGTLSQIPESSTASLLAGLAAIGFVGLRRQPRR